MRTLDRLGHQVTATAVDLAEVTEAVAREDPELSVVVVHNDDEHALDLIEEISAFSGGPVIALISRRRRATSCARAAERGISAVARDGDADALRDAIEVACRRHAESTRLSEQVDRLETALERRAVIERAKGILMERHGVSRARGVRPAARARAVAQPDRGGDRRRGQRGPRAARRRRRLPAVGRVRRMTIVRRGTPGT